MVALGKRETMNNTVSKNNQFETIYHLEFLGLAKRLSASQPAINKMSFYLFAQQFILIAFLYLEIVAFVGLLSAVANT